MLQEIVNQADEAAVLLQRAQQAAEKIRGLRSGDRVYTPLISSAEFSQGTAPSANLVFNVPADTDFWAYRLLVYPYCKVVDPTKASVSALSVVAEEVTYRSTSFVSQSYSPGFVQVGQSDISTLVDATFALIYQGRELQNIDTPIAATYCTNVGKWFQGFWGAASQTPGGLVFDIPMFIPRARSLVCRVTPTYLGVRTKQEDVADRDPITRQHRYKIVGVLEGEKKAGAFR